MRNWNPTRKSYPKSRFKFKFIPFSRIICSFHDSCYYPALDVNKFSAFFVANVLRFVTGLFLDLNKIKASNIQSIPITSNNVKNWHILEHNLLKIVSKGPAFPWQTQIKTIEYGLIDTIRVKQCSYIDTLLIYTLWYGFLSDFDSQSNFGKNHVKKSWSLETLSML